MKKSIILTFAIIVNFFNIYAQRTDSLTFKNVAVSSVVPVTLISSGIVLSGSLFEQEFQTDVRNFVGNDFYFGIDDYIQFTPIAQMYIADLFRVPAKNNWFDQSKYLGFSLALSTTITQIIKRTVQKKRPYGGNYAFPSGHTTFAFTNAMVLFYEYKQTAPFFAYSGFLFASTTGAFRIMNNKHWLSDVLAGAGIGMISTTMIYYFKPLENFNPCKRIKNVSVIPYSDMNFSGLYISMSF